MPKSGWKRNWPVFIRSLISIRRVGWRPQLRISERFEPFIKWTSRILALLGIVSSLFIFPSPLEALGFAIVLFLLQQFIEKALFVYTTIYVQPLPDFEVDKKQWKAMGYAFPEPPGPNKPDICGPAFETEEYALKVHGLFRTWNYDEDEDAENNVCFSIILETTERYTVYIYPNTKRRTAEHFHKRGEELKHSEKHGREHQALIVMMTFCKWFPYPLTSMSRRFIEGQTPDRPFWFQPFLYNAATGKMEIIFEAKPILKWNIKIKRRDELTKDDMEYTFMNQGHKPMGPKSV